MGADLEFGADTETIRAWLAKRATYTQAGTAMVGGRPVAVSGIDSHGIHAPPAVPADPAEPTTPAESVADDPSPEGTPDRSQDVTPRPSVPDSVNAGRSVLEALRANEDGVTPVEPAPSQAERARATAPIEPPPAAAPLGRRGEAVAPQVKQGRWTEPEEFVNARHASTDVDFPARAGVRRALSLVLLLAVVGTAAAGWFAWREATTGAIGLAATAAFLTLVVWAARAGAMVTQLSIKRGQLAVRRGGKVDFADLASPYTPVAIIGEPGLRSWRVLIERPDLPLITVTPSMVDSHWFTTSLYRLRPDLRPGAQAAAREYADQAS